ncbi:MAG: hypothetical protein PHR66_14010 [Desulfuromonadaceae bacterium]|nr:hypothetical protein [Desulfuromonadaceae bacterium]
MFYTILSVILSLSLAACAASHKELDRNPAFSSQQYNSTDMDISWKAEKLNKTVRIEGTIMNIPANSAYDNVAFEAELLDGQGKVIARKTYDFMPLQLQGAEPFNMEIPFGNGVMPEHIKFKYKYGSDDDRFSIKFRLKP